MALVRITALKDFRTTALSTTDVSTGFNSQPTAGQSFYAGLHLTSASLGTTARMLLMTIQAASSSGFPAGLTTQASFLLSTVQGAEWAVPVANVSTDQPWWRANWTLSTAVSTGGAWKGLVYFGLKVLLLCTVTAYGLMA